MLAVCHVLRHFPPTKKIKELIVSGVIGDVVNIQHLEPVSLKSHGILLTLISDSCTTKPVCSDRPREYKKVVFVDRFPFIVHVSMRNHFQGEKKFGLCKWVVTKAGFTVL